MSTYYNKYNKAHDKHGIGFDSLSIINFPAVNVSASQTLASVQAVLSIPQDCMVQHVSVSAQAVSASGQPTFQVVSGNSSTIGSVGTPCSANSNGTPVFSAAQNVPLTAGTQSVFNAAVPAAVCDKTLPLTLRVATASTDTLTGLQVSLAVVPVDPSPDNIPLSIASINKADPSQF
jgi:hypothetical protein